MRFDCLCGAMVVVLAFSEGGCSSPEASSDSGNDTSGGGGSVSTSGTNSGGTNSGGQSGTGGMVATGGQSASGGVAPTGGQSASGGAAAAAGVNAGTDNGGSSGSGAVGGSAALGGGSGAGGAPGGQGGRSGAGGTAAGVGGGARANGGRSAGGTAGSGGSGGGAMTSAGCGKAPTLRNGTMTIQSGSQSRQYIIDIPTNYDNSHPYRLVFGIHWVGGTMTDVATGQTVTRNVWSYYGLKQLANNSTVFVAPQGIGNGWGQGNADLVFFDDMVRQIENDLCIDTTRVFSIGFSYGGAMSYALACARPNVFRAVAIQDAGAISGCSGGSMPIGYFQIHGVRDTTFPIATGRGLRDRFVMNNGCTPQTITDVASGSQTHRCTTYAGCSAGHPLEWCSFDEGHIAAPHDGGNGDNGNTTWVPGEAWRFFTQF